MKIARQNLYGQRKTIESGTQGRKNKELKRHIDLTGSSKITTLYKCHGQKSALPLKVGHAVKFTVAPLTLKNVIRLEIIFF